MFKEVEKHIEMVSKEEKELLDKKKRLLYKTFDCRIGTDTHKKAVAEYKQFCEINGFDA